MWLQQLKQSKEFKLANQMHVVTVLTVAGGERLI